MQHKAVVMLSFILSISAIQPFVAAGWLPCLVSCPDSWDDRPTRFDGLPSCCLEGEQVCSDDGSHILRCGDYDYFGDPIWDFDSCLEFPAVKDDMGYCEYGCKDIVKGVKTSTWSGNIFTGYTENEAVYEMRSGICYETNPCGSGDACSYAGETRCGMINVGGVSQSAVFTCLMDANGCLLWSPQETQVCNYGCYDGKCKERESWEKSECSGGSSDPTKMSAADRKCFGDSLCYCMDRDGDGIFNYDRPTDHPTSCIHCQYGCTELSSPPSCKTDTGETTKGCNPTEKRCYGNFIQRCDMDMGGYYDWRSPVNVLNSDYCQFGCHLGICLQNPDEEAYVAENQCALNESKCIEDNFVTICDDDCGDSDSNTWCWGTVKLCPSFMCNNGKCVETIGNIAKYELNLSQTTSYNIGGLTTDGKYLYTLARENVGSLRDIYIYKLNLNGTVIQKTNITGSLHSVDPSPTNVLEVFTRILSDPCSGAIEYYDENLYIITATPPHDMVATVNRTILRFDMEGNFVGNYTFGSGGNGLPIYNVSICDITEIDGLFYAVLSKYSSATDNRRGGIGAFYTNGSYTETSRMPPGIDVCFMVNESTWLKDYCWYLHYTLDYSTKGSRFVTISHDNGLPFWIGENLLDYGGSGRYLNAYLEAYGEDGFYYGQIANLSHITEQGLTFTGIELIGDTYYFLATSNTNNSYPTYLLRLGTEFTKKNDCFEGSQQCTGWPILNQYVDCVKDNVTGVWKYYQPGMFGDADDSYITRCAAGEVCETYWVNHKLKKAVCVDATCTDVCDIGETRCSADGLWTETCTYMNTTQQTYLGLDIESPIVCKGWNKTEYCGGYYGANFGYCHQGQCLKRQSECEYTNSSVKASRCTYTTEGQLTKEYVVNCTDIDSDGRYEYDLMNASGLLEYCRYGCVQTVTNYNMPYAECLPGPSNSTIGLKNTFGDMTSWFKILFADATSKMFFAIISIALIAGSLSVKSWQLGITSAILLLVGFIAMNFLPLYSMFVLIGFVGIYLYKELSS